MAYILKFISVGPNAERQEVLCFILWIFCFIFVSKLNMQFNTMRLLAVQSEVNDLFYGFAKLLEMISTQS